jgi:hypothetical protein
VGISLLFAAAFMTANVPAQADTPGKITVPVVGTFVLAECDGFDVIDEYTGVLTITEFYSQDGELERLTFQENSQDRIYNSVTGFSVSNKYTVNQTYYPTAGELYIRGVAHNITVPGYGIVYFDSGLGVYYIIDGSFILVKFAGNYQADTAPLCEAMEQMAFSSDDAHHRAGALYRLHLKIPVHPCMDDTQEVGFETVILI